MSSTNQTNRFEVFYDGKCPLCKREIDMIRRKDKQGTLLLTDIASDDFVPTDRSLETLMRQIHGRYPDGTYVVGVDVFREIYTRLGFSGWVAPTRWFGIRHVMDLFYRFFAYLRFRHALHRMPEIVTGVKEGDSCGSCQVPTPAAASKRSLAESKSV